MLLCRQLRSTTPGRQFTTQTTRLAPLAANGAPLAANRTHALLPGSPAIDAGTNSGCPATDQRGFARPMDGDGDSTATCDIGAYEVQVADLSLSKAGSPDPLTLGASLTYTVVVTNNGPSDATAVVLTDTLPASVTFGSAAPSQGSCTGTATVLCSLGAISSGASATVIIVVTPTAAGDIVNMAVVTGNEHDPNTANNSDSETTTVELFKLYLPLVLRSD